MSGKVSRGQFYTQGNPFIYPVFKEWMDNLPKGHKSSIVEPFGGANNIIRLVAEAGFEHGGWTSYDIEPEAQSINVTPDYPVHQRDTIADFPEGFDVAITNPPYLAKNSAKRKGWEMDFGAYSDLYQVALDHMLAKTAYVAAIIPESFITSKFLKDRCDVIISLNEPMFDDTDHPVCLALFSPNSTNDFVLYSGDRKLGKFSELQKSISWLTETSGVKIKPVFNDPQGILGFRGIDSTSGRSIEFVKGDTIPSSSIKVSSRALTRITLPMEYDLDAFIAHGNELIEKYRDDTEDVFLTSFKGLRKDRHYRRRMDFATAALIINAVIKQANSEKSLK